MSKHILIVDDSELIVSMLSMVCQQLGYQVFSSYDIQSLPQIISAQSPDAVLCDLNIPGSTDPVAEIKQIPALATKPLILISGISQDELDTIAEERGADAAISKDGGLPAIMSLLGPTLSILLA